MKIEYSSADVDLIAGGVLALRAVGLRVRVELVGGWLIGQPGYDVDDAEEVVFKSPVAAELLDDNTLEILYMGQVAVAIGPAVPITLHSATIVVMSQESKIRQPLLVTH